MNPPSVYELTMPNNQRITSKTAIVQSIAAPLWKSVFVTSNSTKLYAGDVG